MTDFHLPPAELDVMSCLWGGLGTAAEIREKLAERRPMAHASVCTLLKRLEEKSFVERQKGPVGKAYVYRPLVQPAKTSRSILGGLLDRLFGGNGVALIASLLETRPPSDAELSELQSLLTTLKKARRSTTTVKSRGKRRKQS